MSNRIDLGMHTMGCHMHTPEKICTCGHKSPDSNGLLHGGEYNFKHQPERLKYIGKEKGWHQFEEIGKQGVWCELLDEDLYMVEETINNKGRDDG